MDFLGEIFEDIFDNDRRKKRGHNDHGYGHHKGEHYDEHDRHHGRDNYYKPERDNAQAYGYNNSARGAGMVCQNCGKIEQSGNRFCGNCGTQMGAERRCSHCTAKLRPNDRFCISCGAPA